MDWIRNENVINFTNNEIKNLCSFDNTLQIFFLGLYLPGKRYKARKARTILTQKGNQMPPRMQRRYFREIPYFRSEIKEILMNMNMKMRQVEKQSYKGTDRLSFMEMETRWWY